MPSEVRALNLCRRLAGLHADNVRAHALQGTLCSEAGHLALTMQELYADLAFSGEHGVSLAEAVGVKLLLAYSSIDFWRDDQCAMRYCADARVEALEELQAVIAGEKGGGDGGHD
jgi:hypothetical protein